MFYIHIILKIKFTQDDERLRNERVRALKAKERFAQSLSGIGSDTVSYFFSFYLILFYY